MNEHSSLNLQSTVTSKGQTTIPKELRDVLGIKPGTPLRWKLENGVLTVRAKTRRLEEFAGVLAARSDGRQVSIEEMNEAVLDEAADRFRRTTAR